MYCTLKNAKPPSRKNLTQDEQQAIKGLWNDKSILVLKADKGNCTVVMNMADYNHQVHEMLEDRTTYKPVTDKRRNPTKRIETDLQKKLLDLRKNNNLTEAEYKRLRPCDSTPASFYGLPKIHKVQLQPANDHLILPKNIATTSVPLRPINSCIGAPTDETSKHLAAILRNL